MDSVATVLEEIHCKISAAAKYSGREASDVRLLAVSKTFPAKAVAEAAAVGQLLFGESKLQEASGKIPLLDASLEWHFIGNLQRNKVRKTLPLFPVIHSISSLKLAKYTDAVAQDLACKPQVYLEVNIGTEESKHGFLPDELRSAISEICELPNLNVLGLMAIPPAVEHRENARPYFVKVRELRDELEVQVGEKLPGLSMGMSNDYTLAIEEGATIVRVGSAIFGNRDYT